MSDLATETQQILEVRNRDAEIRRQAEQEISEHVQGLLQTRDTLETLLQKYGEQCASLQRVVRRSSAVLDSAPYRSFASLQLRMVGAINQAIRRSAAMDRLIDAAKAEEQERSQREERERILLENRVTAQEVQELQRPREDDFDLLYGEM